MRICRLATTPWISQVEERMNSSKHFNEAPMTYRRASFFPHRSNSDGFLTSICLTCCATVASHKTEEDLVEFDKKYICETTMLSDDEIRTGSDLRKTRGDSSERGNRHQFPGEDKVASRFSLRNYRPKRGFMPLRCHSRTPEPALLASLKQAAHR
jgi:hypothetical protein